MSDYDRSQMMNPLRCKAPAIALVCLVVLGLSLHATTGFEWLAGIIGVLCAAFFWIDCLIWLSDANRSPENP